MICVLFILLYDKSLPPTYFNIIIECVALENIFYILYQHVTINMIVSSSSLQIQKTNLVHCVV